MVHGPSNDEVEKCKRVRQLEFAADDGHAESMFLLAIAYAQGKGVEMDETVAARWFHQAARLGHARARTSMGYLYSIGRGVRHDVVLGYVFLTQAADAGDPLARDLLVRLRRQMSPAQLKEAQRRVQNRTAS